jgi:hypothetical protein
LGGKRWPGNQIFVKAYPIPNNIDFKNFVDRDGTRDYPIDN